MLRPRTFVVGCCLGLDRWRQSWRESRRGSVHKNLPSISRFLDFSISQFLSFSIPRFLNFSISQFLDFSVSQFLNFSISQFLSFSVSQFLNFSISQFLNFSISRYFSLVQPWPRVAAGERWGRASASDVCGAGRQSILEEGEEAKLDEEIS